MYQRDYMEIKKKLKEDGYVNKAIDYEELKSLKEKYGKTLSERDFAIEILEIPVASYVRLKNYPKEKCRILKSLTMPTLQERRAIENAKRKLKEDGYAGKFIDYDELQKLHKQYLPKMDEIDFAKYVLELHQTDYRDMMEKNVRRQIIRSQIVELTEKQLIEIKEELKRQGYAGKTITYEEVQMLHQIYLPEMQEGAFVREVLELPKYSYGNIKNKGERATILRSMIRKLQKGEIEEILEKLKELGYVGKTINYTEFRQLHQTYAEGTEDREFAKEVLEISYEDFKMMKDKNKKAKILLSLVNSISENKVKEIRIKLLEQGYSGRLITYEELRELYEQYGSGLNEVDFANYVLEISYLDYSSIKYGKPDTRVPCFNKKNKSLEKMILKESRYYTKEEIEQICTENNITIKQLMLLARCKDFIPLQNEYEKIIRKGKIWIGHTPMSKEFVDNNWKTFLKIAKNVLTNIKDKYKINYNINDDDIVQEVMFYIVRNRGDIEKNFLGNSEIIEKIIELNLKRYVTYEVLHITGRLKINRSSKRIYKRQNGKYHLNISVKRPDKSDDRSEDKADSEEKIQEAETCVHELSEKLREGKTTESAIESTARKLGLRQEEILESMRLYLINKGKVKNQNGTIAVNREKKEEDEREI